MMFDENDESEVKTQLLSDMELMRLDNCQKSTKLGMSDQVFEPIMIRLAAHGLVKKVGPGYQTTALGEIHLREQKDRVAKL